MSQGRDSVRVSTTHEGKSFLRSVLTVSALGALSLVPGGGFPGSLYWETRDRETTSRLAAIDRRLRELEKASDLTGSPQQRAAELADRFLKGMEQSEIVSLETFFQELPSDDLLQLTSDLIELQSSIVGTISPDPDEIAPNLAAILVESLRDAPMPATRVHKTPNPQLSGREVLTPDQTENSVLDPIGKLSAVDWQCVFSLVQDARHILLPLAELAREPDSHVPDHAIDFCELFSYANPLRSHDEDQAVVELILSSPTERFFLLPGACLELLHYTRSLAAELLHMNSALLLPIGAVEEVTRQIGTLRHALAAISAQLAHEDLAPGRRMLELFSNDVLRIHESAGRMSDVLGTSKYHEYLRLMMEARPHGSRVLPNVHDALDLAVVTDSLGSSKPIVLVTSSRATIEAAMKIGDLPPWTVRRPTAHAFWMLLMHRPGDPDSKRAMLLSAFHVTNRIAAKVEEVEELLKTTQLLARAPTREAIRHAEQVYSTFVRHVVAFREEVFTPLMEPYYLATTAGLGNTVVDSELGDLKVMEYSRAIQAVIDTVRELVAHLRPLECPVPEWC